MGIRVSAYTIAVGDTQQLEMTAGEDREFQLTFQEGTPAAAKDLTNTTALKMTVRNRANGLVIFARSYTGFQGSPTLGTPRFQILQADTVNLSAQVYDVDVQWVDTFNYTTELMATSSLLILKAAGKTTDTVTTPPAIPVTYGLTWLGVYTGKSGGYNLNDAVTAFDGWGPTTISSFRAAMQGVTCYPMTGTVSPTVATGWGYIARGA